METKANYAIVGLFTVFIMIAAFGFVYWMSQFGRTGDLAPLTIRIEGSANGLSAGSPVRFNGIAIGSVRSLTIDKSNPRFVLAHTEVLLSAPIYPSTQAVLEVQGLTGAAYIGLIGGKPGEENILYIPSDDQEPAHINARQSSVTNLLATADVLLTRIDSVVTEIEGFVGDVRTPLTNTMLNAEVFSQSLADNAKGIDEFLKSVSSLSTTFSSLSGRLDATLAAAEDLIKAVDTEKVANIVTSVDKFSTGLADSTGDITAALKEFRRVAVTFEQFGANATKTLDKVDTIVAAVDSKKVEGVVEDIAIASKTARQAVDDAAKVTARFGARSEDIDQVITDISQMAKRLNEASTRVDGILAKVDGVLGGGDTGSVMTELRETIANFNKLAVNLNKRVNPIAANLERFTGSGLRDFEALVRTARGSISRIERSISSLEQNPQRVIFGGETVKQYQGRKRH